MSPKNRPQKPTEAEKERIRKEAEAEAKAAEKERAEERRRRAKDPKTVKKAEDGEEPLDTQLCRTYGKVHEENEGERRQRNLREAEGDDDFVPARRPLEEEDGDVVVDEAAPPAQERRGHKGGYA